MLSVKDVKTFLLKPSNIILRPLTISLPDSNKSDNNLVAVTGLPRASFTTSPVLETFFK